MGDILTYAKSFLKTLDECPFNEIDSLILSWISYLHYPDKLHKAYTWDGLCIRDIFCDEIIDLIMRNIYFPEKMIELLTYMSDNPRFRDVKIFGYEYETDCNSYKQFSAVTFQLTHELCYVAYRGTDDTFVGWKEDMKLTLDAPIPSQIDAVKYLEKAASKINGRLMAGGHSKGGNLAVYAAAKCLPCVQERIISVYSHDGPGFQRNFLDDEGFKRIQPVIYKTLPQSSLIGMIFEQECEYHIVKSNVNGVAQHIPLSWEIEDGRFCLAEELTPDAKLLYKSLNNWVSGLKVDEREKFINVVFEILEETNVSDFKELAANLHQNIPIIVKRIILLDIKTKAFFFKMIYQLATIGLKNAFKIFGKKHRHIDSE